MVRSAKETSGAIARLKHDNEARNKFAKQSNDFLKSPVCFQHSGNILVSSAINCVARSIVPSLVSSLQYFTNI